MKIKMTLLRYFDANAVVGLVSIFRAVVLVIGVLLFFYFRQMQHDEDKKIIANVQTILRNEANLQNTYALSKTIVDLEKLGIFRCATLRESGSKFTYYDTISSTECIKAPFLSARLVNVDLKTNNGFIYHLSFLKKLNIFSLVVELGGYLLLILLGLIFPRYLRSLENKMKLKLQVADIEKRVLKEHAEQITHDVASPLSAIKMVVSLLKDIDPEIKEVLLNSVVRTQSIFDELKNTQRVAMTDVNLVVCLNQIILEKKKLWAENCEIDFDSRSSTLRMIVAQEGDFKRIISNILNNAFESMEEKNEKKIIIKIQEIDDEILVSISDIGKGISDIVLSKIGTKGFSFGKEVNINSRRGLGVYHAKETMRTWGGELTIKSTLNQGTQICLRFKIAKELSLD